jgi:hypothetical protein
VVQLEQRNLWMRTFSPSFHLDALMTIHEKAFCHSSDKQYCEKIDITLERKKSTESL